MIFCVPFQNTETFIQVEVSCLRSEFHSRISRSGHDHLTAPGAGISSCSRFVQLKESLEEWVVNLLDKGGAAAVITINIKETLGYGNPLQEKGFNSHVFDEAREKSAGTEISDFLSGREISPESKDSKKY